MNLLSGKKSVKHHSKNCCEENANLVKKIQKEGGYTRVHFHSRKTSHSTFFLFFKGSFLVTCDGH